MALAFSCVYYSLLSANDGLLARSCEYSLNCQPEQLREMCSLEESVSETESDRYSSENEEYQIEVEADCVFEPDEKPTQEPYADEPIADAEWLANYRKEQEENEQLEKELKQRLENAVPVGEW